MLDLDRAAQLEAEKPNQKKNTDAALKESNASLVLVCGFRRILTRDANL
jgi:hypothetical protein